MQHWARSGLTWLTNLVIETRLAMASCDALRGAGSPAGDGRPQTMAHGRLRAGGCPWVGMVSAEGAALIAWPPDAWVGMRSSDGPAAGALGAGTAAVAGGGAGFGAGDGGDTGGSGAGAGFAATSGFGGSGLAAGVGAGGWWTGGAASPAALGRAGAGGGGVTGAAVGVERAARPLADGRSTDGAGVGAGDGFATTGGGAGAEAADGAGGEETDGRKKPGRGIVGTPYWCT